MGIWSCGMHEPVRVASSDCLSLGPKTAGLAWAKTLRRVVPEKFSTRPGNFSTRPENRVTGSHFGVGPASLSCNMTPDLRRRHFSPCRLFGAFLAETRGSFASCRPGLADASTGRVLAAGRICVCDDVDIPEGGWGLRIGPAGQVGGHASLGAGLGCGVGGEHGGTGERGGPGGPPHGGT